MIKTAVVLAGGIMALTGTFFGIWANPKRKDLYLGLILAGFTTMLVGSFL